MPKMSCPDRPPRAVSVATQIAELLVEVPGVSSCVLVPQTGNQLVEVLAASQPELQQHSVDQTVDIPVQCGDGRCGEYQGPGAEFNSFFLSASLFSCCVENSGGPVDCFFCTFLWSPKSGRVAAQSAPLDEPIVWDDEEFDGVVPLRGPSGTGLPRTTSSESYCG